MSAPVTPGPIDANFVGGKLVRTPTPEAKAESKSNCFGRAVTKLKASFANAGDKIKTAFASETAKNVGKVALCVLVGLAITACIVGIPFTAGLSLAIPLSVALLVLSSLSIYRAIKNEQ